MTTLKTKDVDTSRRQAMGVIGAISALGITGLIGYNESSATSSRLFAGAAAETAGASSHVLIPNHTLGTFPLATILNNSSFLREVIHEDKPGIPLTVKLKLVNVNDNYTPISGYIYIWHCDNNGLYSGHESSNALGQSETYCRGLQPTNADGQATFATIYPGQDEGRAPHINFQIFLTTQPGSTSLSAISQMTFPREVTAAVYQTSLYNKDQSIAETFSSDNLLSDGVAYQMATVTGNTVEGYVAELEVGIAVA